MRLASVACALLIILAGCGSVIDTSQSPSPSATPASTPSSTSTPTPASDSVSVPIGESPIDPDPVFDRVVNLTGEQAEAPSVQVYDRRGPQSTGSESAFYTAMGVDRPDDPLRPKAVAPGPSTIRLYEPPATNSTRAESVLAHEFVHTVQYQSGWFAAVNSELGGDWTADESEVASLVLEGTATYLQGQYERQYLPSVQPAPIAQDSRYEDAVGYNRLVISSYAIGSAYVENRLDAGASLAEVNRNPPASTEQVLHGTDDPIAPLNTTTVEAGEWTTTTRDTQGELFLRIALRTELNRSAAVDAAHGWGNDSRISYKRGSDTGTVWTHRWDDAANATEFESAFAQYLDTRATLKDGVWTENDGASTYRLERINDRTTVVFLGDESFVRGANATTEAEGEVHIVLGNASEG